MIKWTEKEILLLEWIDLRGDIKLVIQLRKFPDINDKTNIKIIKYFDEKMWEGILMDIS